MLRGDLVLNKFEGDFSALEIAQREAGQVNLRHVRGNAYLDGLEALTAATAQVKTPLFRP